MRRSTFPALCAAALPLLLFPFLLYAGTGKSGANATPVANNPSEGERLFAINCGRCHQPPMSIAPRITGTIIMHMRTRARLSRKDEQALLRFLAP